MKVLDAGHKYQLTELDGGKGQIKRFVKREGANYPGNVGSYPGITLQESWRADIDRLKYVNDQTPCAESAACIELLRTAILLLEVRAKRVKGSVLEAATHKIESAATCPDCGHIFCTEDHASRGDADREMYGDDPENFGLDDIGSK